MRTSAIIQMKSNKWEWVSLVKNSDSVCLQILVVRFRHKSHWRFKKNENKDFQLWIKMVKIIFKPLNIQVYFKHPLTETSKYFKVKLWFCIFDHARLLNYSRLARATLFCHLIIKWPKHTKKCSLCALMRMRFRFMWK